MSPATCEIDEPETAIERGTSGRWMPLQHFDPGFIDAVVEQLDALRTLDRGWDGYDAPPIRADIIESARRMITGLHHLAPRPRVVPLSSGGLQLEWTAASHALELEFETPDAIHYLRWQPANGIQDENFVAADDLDAVRELIRWYLRADV